MGSLFSTEHVQPNERFDYWLHMISTLYVPLECKVDSLSQFHGAIKQYILPSLDISRVHSKAQCIHRNQSSVNNDTQHYFIIKIQIKGYCYFSQHHAEHILAPNHFVLLDSRLPYHLKFTEDFEQIVLKINAQQLAELQNIQSLIARPISATSGAGHLFLTMIYSLLEQFEQDILFQQKDLAFVKQSILGLFLASLAQAKHIHENHDGGSLQSSLELYHIERIKQHIERRLTDPTITIKKIAEELQMSTSYLHRLFQTQDLSPSQYLWKRRLDACSVDLLDDSPSCAMTISQIAYKWGFNDAAHFSRTFKSHFGCSPSEWKRQH